MSLCKPVESHLQASLFYYPTAGATREILDNVGMPPVLHRE